MLIHATYTKLMIIWWEHNKSGLIDFNQNSWGQSIILLKSINKLLFL